MEVDVRQLVGLIVVAAGAGVVIMSYVAAYLVGRGHGRREAQLAMREAEHRLSTDRMSVVEGAVDSIAQSLARVTDAQRLMLAQQDSLVRRASGDRVGIKPNTPPQ